MPHFSFTARDTTGGTQRGTLEAASASALAGDLRGRGLLVLEVRPSSGGSGSFSLARLNPLRNLKPKSAHIEQSFQQMAIMLRSGLTLLACLKTVSEQAQRQSMRDIWKAVAERIQEGSSLADAMAQHRCFSRLVVQLIRVGEQTGSLEVVMIRSADTMESRRTLRNNVLTAMMYPMVALVMALGVAVFMVTNIIPQLSKFLEGMHKKLPPMTQMLMDLSRFVTEYGGMIMIGIFTVIGGVVAVYMSEPGRRWMDRYMLRIPIIGTVMRLAGTVTFSSTMEIMLRSGVTMLESLRTAEQIHGNRYLAECVANARNRVLSGGGLAASLAAPYGYMPLLSRMVAVGETGGTLEEVLAEVTKYHQYRLQGMIKALSALIEPVIIVIVGGIVGFVYIAFFMALFSVAGGGK